MTEWMLAAKSELGWTSIEDDGAHARIRTGDLFLTKEMLYRLSYVGGGSHRFYLPEGGRPAGRPPHQRLIYQL